MALDVVFLKRAEEPAVPQASILELLPEGHGAQARLGEGLAHGPAGLREGGDRGHRHWQRRLPICSPAAAHVVELLNALINQGWRGLLVGHCHSTTEEHLELLGERVIELGRAAQLLLAGDLAGLSDGADDLRHLCEQEECYLELAQ